MPLTSRQRLVLDATAPFFAFAWLGIVHVVLRAVLARRLRNMSRAEGEAELVALRRAYLRTLCALFLFTFSEVRVHPAAKVVVLESSALGLLRRCRGWARF
jgi:hypothetical protein